MEIVIQDVRCFSGRHTIPFRPLTLLVGENSTGKSTFLAMLAHLSGAGFPSLRPSFSPPPFDLGNFESIATFKHGKHPATQEFSVGFNVSGTAGDPRLLATYTNVRNQPQLSQFLAAGGGSEIRCEIDPQSSSGKIFVKTSKGKKLEAALETVHMPTGGGNLILTLLIQSALYGVMSKEETPKQQQLTQEELIEVLNLTSGVRRSVLALAPIRTKPRRTYDEVNDTFAPEGDHIPVLLARILQGKEGDERANLLRILRETGASTSLFDRILVKRLGKKPSEPFRVMVKTSGPAVNLPDVGYGVSQALPLIVQSALTEGHRLLLLQQPEIHLHPKAQAALGSFFAKQAGKEDKHFVIETHSDFLVDRIRLEVANGTIKSDEVLILFFEKKSAETTVHSIFLDETGNVLKAPRSYRRFFLEEETKIISRSTK